MRSSYHNAQSRLREMSILYEVGQRLTSILDLPQLGKELTHFMARALNMTYCGLQVFEAGSGHAAHDRQVSVARGRARRHGSRVLPITIGWPIIPTLQAAIEQHDIQIVYRDEPVLHPSDQACWNSITSSPC